MNRKIRYYPPEFKREALAMLATGEHTMAQLERELGITAGLLRQWKRRAEQTRGNVSPNEIPVTSEAAKARIRELERENARLRQEREILKKERWPSSAAETSEIPVYRGASGRV